MLASSCSGSTVCTSFGGHLVNLNLLLILRPCPFNVSSLSGECLATAFVVSPGHDANCLFLIAFIHVGFVRNPAVTWRYQISSGWVLSLYTLWTASLGGDLSGKYSVGGFVVKTVSVFSFRMVGTRGTRHSFAVLSYHPCKIACHVTNPFVSLAS